MKYVNIVVLIALGVSCNFSVGDGSLNPIPREFEDQITLIPSDTLIVRLEMTSSIHSNYVVLEKFHGKPYLGLVNENSNQLEFYSLKDPKENFKVNFLREGPNGIGTLKGFVSLGDSTLLVGSSDRTRLFVSDLEGNIIRRYKTKVERRDGPYVQIYYSSQPLIFNASINSFFMFTRVDTDYSKPGLWSGSSFLKVSERISEEASHVFELPKHLSAYVHGAFFSHSSHVMIDEKYLVLGIPFYNDLILYDMVTDKVFQRPAGSKYFGDVMPWPNPDNERDEEFYVSSNSYQGLVYDELNRLLYRTAFRGVDYIDLNGQKRNTEDKIPSLIILDEDLVKLGEFDLPAGTFYTRTTFSHEGKIYLSLNHPDRQTSEDELVFVGFEPIEK
jgi:hypothetical protein